jgi:hypothetical protein
VVTAAAKLFVSSICVSGNGTAIRDKSGGFERGEGLEWRSELSRLDLYDRYRASQYDGSACGR